MAVAPTPAAPQAPSQQTNHGDLGTAPSVEAELRPFCHEID
jgi:hypothetical protein